MVALRSALDLLEAVVGPSPDGGLPNVGARAAFIDVDDIRHLVVAGAKRPRHEPEGTAQADLRAENVRGLARRFLARGFDVVIADVLTPRTVSWWHSWISTSKCPRATA